MHTHKPIASNIMNRLYRGPAKRTLARQLFRYPLLRAAVMLAVTAWGANAHAALVAPGSSEMLDGTTSSVQSALAGTVLQDVMEPFTINLGFGTINGYVQDRVVQESGSGTLDFYYRILNGMDSDGCTLSSNGSIGVVSRSNYSGYSTDANYRTDGLGTVDPSAASRSANGAQMLFGFLTNPIGPGQESQFFFVKTNATAYNDLGTGTLLGFNSGGGFGQTEFSTFQPVAPVPLAPAFWLFASGLLGLMAVGWRARSERESLGLS